MPEDVDIKFMHRCLELAGKAEGMTYPNPMVGAVIVHNGVITGEGYHTKAGSPHAEFHAIKAVADKSTLRSSTLYVNLEPCSHFGKTPPCADLIISHGIPEVVAGTIDTSGNVSGRGIARLKEAGCKVSTGVLENECRNLNRRFFTFHEKKRPYIILKWAQSADGFIDGKRDKNGLKGPNWITGRTERVLVHRWRASEQAILAGAGTVRTDNPRLDVREWGGNNPVRIILSGSGNLGKELAISGLVGSGILFTFNGKAHIPGCVVVKLDSDKPAAEQITDYLFESGIQSLMVEGGAQVINHFISNGLWDEARVFSGLSYFREGVKAPAVEGKVAGETDFGLSSLAIVTNGAG